MYESPHLEVFEFGAMSILTSASLSKEDLGYFEGSDERGDIPDEL